MVPGEVHLVASDAASTLPPLLEPSTSLQQAVEGDTLGLGFAAAG